RDFADWISPLNFYAAHNELISKCTPRTGQWFLKDTQFLHWIAGEIRFIWCPGAPGVGKTIIASLVVEHLQSIVSTDTNTTLARIYCDYNQRAIQTSSALISSILRQIIISSSSIPVPVMQLHALFRSRKPCPSDLTKTLLDQLLLYNRVYIVVDALDECSESEGMVFIAWLRSLSDHVSVLVTSRNLTYISQEFRHDPRIDISAHKSDLQTYIEGRIFNDKRLRLCLKRDPDLQNEIIVQVIKKAQGM
ncbi:hypothetical protein C8J56DRAFT_771039, partial [Mycena floridula]